MIELAGARSLRQVCREAKGQVAVLRGRKMLEMPYDNEYVKNFRVEDILVIF